MDEAAMTWPDDADGDAFRRLSVSGFDFSNAVSVDYVVDFETWPPPGEALDLLTSMFGELHIVPPDHEGAGYVEFQEVGPLTYERVASIQAQTCNAMLPFGGFCDSWGVLH